MKIKIEYRKGAIGAMTDEYEKALNELIVVLETVSEEVFFAPIKSNDEDCKSIRNIVFHVVKTVMLIVIIFGNILEMNFLILKL